MATGPGIDDPSTWRWQVNAILTEQSVTVSRPAADLSSFDQGYERYSPWDYSNPNETILDKRSLRSAFVDTIGG